MRRRLYLLPLGIAIGAGVGVVMHNVGMGVAIGVAVGAMMSIVSQRRGRY
jgi:F0F1-type ATP synthase membrane subunit c/vacuolar-type H+-ATPase subunit K